MSVNRLPFLNPVVKNLLSVRNFSGPSLVHFLRGTKEGRDQTPELLYRATSFLRFKDPGFPSVMSRQSRHCRSRPVLGKRGPPETTKKFTKDVDQVILPMP